jgi:hypothetical protein
MTSTGFHANVPYRLLQGVRLVHALMESDYRVHIPAEHADKFSRLQEVFGVDFTLGVAGVSELPGVIVSHREPLTAIGSLQRALIFPRAVVRHCRGLWPDERTVRFSFAGLVTEKRRAVLDAWVRRTLPRSRVKIGNRTVFDRVASRVRRALGAAADPVGSPAGELVLWSSNRGRQFPGKSWDEEYYALLARSQFVLCPSGDHVWSYRFFESALCGAIPIVEQPCPAYEGFTYRTMDESLADVRWNLQDAQHNFALCEARLTVPVDELNAEIASLLTPSASVRTGTAD